jgi:hypothetical protein
MRLLTIAKYLVFVIIGIFAILFVLNFTHIYQAKELEYGVTFSSKQSTDLGLDWKKVYEDMLDDLQVKKLRLPAYWDQLEPSANTYDWTDLDWQVSEATKRNVDLILVVGQRVPRWPECHIPTWVNKNDQAGRETAVLNYITQTVNRYKNNPNVRYWQVENEPFLIHFGTCPAFNVNFLDQEIALVKSLDTKPIIVTDSGELSLWVHAARRADIFGSTMYRDTYSQFLHSYIHYPISPAFFRIKKNFASLFAHPQDWIVVELQGEPWGREAYQTLSQTEREQTMTPAKFKDTISFIQQTGFKTFYWWGVEYWYWEKTKNNNPFYWDTAKKLFQHTYDQ